MARRHEYVSFFRESPRRRGDLVGLEGRVGLTRILMLGLGVAVLAVSLWWFGFRDADENVGVIVTMDDAAIPTLILPAGVDGGEGLGTEGTFECFETAIGWSTFQGGPARTGCAATPLIREPRILWKAEVGVQGWLNNPIVVDNSVFVASAGVAQFVSDRRDAIYALDVRTGKQLWYYQAEQDVNGIGYYDGIVIATGDEGRVWGLSARDGHSVWVVDFGTDSPTYSNPLTIDGMVVIGDDLGRVTALDVLTGKQLWQQQVAGAVRGGAASDGERIYVTGEEHEVLAVDMSGREVWRAEVRGRGQAAEGTRIFATPTIAGELVIVTLIRADIYAEPAVVALNRATGEIVWQAIDVAGIKTGDWANIRSSVAVAGEVVVFGEAYSDLLVALDLHTGQTRWSVPIGSYCLPHWPSPLITGNQVILARDDGGLYAIDLTERTLAWQIYLGNSRAQPSGNFPPGFDADFCEESESGYQILSTPALTSAGVIIVGTLEGFIYAIADRSW